MVRGSVKSDPSVSRTAWNPTEEASLENSPSLELASLVAITVCCLSNLTMVSHTELPSFLILSSTGLGAGRPLRSWPAIPKGTHLGVVVTFLAAKFS